MPVVYTGGTFDVPHVGHVNFLRQCRKLAGLGGRVVVSLNTDEFIQAFKGKPPLFRFEERKKLLEKIEYVDKVIANFGGQDSKPAILKVKPDFIVIGSDWAKKDYYAQMGFTQEWLDNHQIILVYVPYTEVISTSEIKTRTNLSSGLPLVSVGLPTYNRAQLLDECIKSLTQQNYSNLEIIIADNQATDWTPLLLDNWEKKDKRIKHYYHKKPISAIENAHFTLEKATGKYFFWASDDDLWDANFVSETVSMMEKDIDQKAILVAPLWRVMDQKRKIRRDIKTSFAKSKHNWISFEDFLREPLRGYKGNLYWGLYRTKELKDLLASTRLPKLPHNDLFTLQAVLARYPVRLLKKELFTKSEYFADARKPRYTFFHKIIDGGTRILVWWRILINLFWPTRWLYFLSVVWRFYQFNHRLIRQYFSGNLRLTSLNVMASVRFFLHLIPNDIKVYRQRVITFGG